MKEPTVVLTVRVPVDLRTRIAARAAERCRGISRPDTVGVVTDALKSYLDQLDQADKAGKGRKVRRG